ncbi:Hypothetical predicted protein [Prunus dulcis]|uniref:Uncharacterized protein n=1 Tax=Prunus dulcis TaxID=3755 RepID=A0A5E4E6T2_PRUDU|nr:Hypothetical predicted protein [Prunus dulcis]
MEAKCAFLLALIACFEIVCIEGRPFWPKNKELISTIEANSKRELGEQGSQPTPHHIASPMAPDHDSISGTHAAYTHDFRPTTPGNSPGVGHKFTHTREQPAKARKSVTAGTRPTAPGHSPGVGHVVQLQNAKPSP